MRKFINRNLRLCSLQLGQVFEASNGEEALAVLDKENVSVILTDIHMPVMSGDEMVLKMKENPKTAGTPVVFISSDSSVAQVERLLQKGAGFIHKPFSPERIEEAIQGVMDVPQ